MQIVEVVPAESSDQPPEGPSGEPSHPMLRGVGSRVPAERPSPPAEAGSGQGSQPRSKWRGPEAAESWASAEGAARSRAQS